MVAKNYIACWILTLVIGVNLAQSITLGKVIYVDADAPGANNGSSWYDAFTDLCDALIKADSGDEIRVAQGTYRSTVPNGDREEAFFLSQAQGAEIKGGFAGYGALNPDANDPNYYETFLSGDLNGNDGPNFANNDENSYHVLDGSDTYELTTLDGFTIRGGNANGIRWREMNGGGIWNMGGNLKIINCLFTRNSADNNGGGIFNSPSDDPTPIPSCLELKHCKLIENSAKYGGGMFNVDSTPNLVHCTFSGNLSSHGAGMYNDNSCAIIISCSFMANICSYGGGIFNYTSCPELTNCIFNANFAGWGAGIFNYDNSPILTNCTFSRNIANNIGGGTYNIDANPTFTNCIFWYNSDSGGIDEAAQIHMINGIPIVNYCCVQGWTDIWGGIGNIYLNPLFIDDDGDDNVAGTEDDNLRLMYGSPCIDTGDNNSLPSDVLDLDGDGDTNELIPFDYNDNPRIVNDIVDMGAFEFGHLGLHEVFYVDADATGANEGTSWKDAFTNLQDALWNATMNPEVREIRIAQGLYQPAGINGRRDATFQLINGVSIKGGYAGYDELDPNTRNTEIYETILSGDLNGNDANMVDPCCYLTDPNRIENSYHVVTGSGTDGTAVLDGVTIIGGTANGPYDEDGSGIYIMIGNPTIRHCKLLGNAAQGDGGGIYCLFSDPNIKECKISGNFAELGAGIYCLGSCPTVTENIIVANCATSGGGICCGYQSCPTIKQNIIKSNWTDQYGGGISCVDGSSPNISCNTIQNNSAFDGGGIYCFYSDPNIFNNIITGNIASDDGGGIACIKSSGSVIKNNTLVGNVANPQGGGIYCEETVPIITNCILWNNGDDLHAYTKSTAGLDCHSTYCCIEDGDSGLGNIPLAPYFVDSVNGDYHLMPYSLCIDAGDPNSDYSLEPLPNGDRINMGAYGNTLEATTKSEDSDDDGIPDDWEIEHFGDLTQSDLDIDGDDVNNLQEYLAGTNPHLAYEGLLETVYVSSANIGDPLADGSYAHPFASIQQGIDAARDGGQILVTMGTFYEFLIIDDKILDIIGGYDLNFTGIYDFTTLSGQGQGRPVLYVNTQDGLLSGFIITDGLESDGSGMYIFNSSPEITNNIIKHNTSLDDGAIYCYYNSAPLFQFNTIRDNHTYDNGGGIYLRESTPTFWSCVFMGNKANEGGSMRITNATPSIINCTIIQNEAEDIAGGISCTKGSAPIIRDCSISYNKAKHGNGGGIFGIEHSSLTLTDCVIQGNTPDGVWINEGSAEISGIVQIISNDLIGRDFQLTGNGLLQTSSDVLLKMDNSIISCNVTGAATIQVELNTKLTIQDNADVNLAGGGMIQCDGELRVKDNSRISNAIIEVSRASFEGDADIFNNVIKTGDGITAGIGSPYGQFFIEDTVTIIGNKIYADGDRFMDLDPSQFNGFISNDEIHVTITEGVHGTRGGLLELRGKDILDPNYYQCHPDTHLCQVDPCEFPDFDQNTWMLEELVLSAGAKLNLTNRFDFQPPFDYGGDYEVLYVKQLILGPNSVLNTAYNRIYYKTLEMDPTSRITCEPLLGFSLNMITFDDEIEFVTRIRHNNLTNPDNSNFDRIHVERVEDLEPDPHGMMQMCNLIDRNPGSPDYGQVVNARAKGLFAKSNEDKILIRFEYLFDTFDPNVELVVYLTDVPELMEHGDPNREQHYIKVAQLQVPPEGRPGSPGSDRFGVFHQYVWKGNLDFIRGTRIELELIGPDGACVLINNLDPQVHCSTLYCMDVTGEHGVTELDFLTVLCFLGAETEMDPNDNESLFCLEFGWIWDGVVDAFDLMFWDWGVESALNGDDITDLCKISGVPLVSGGESTNTTASSIENPDGSERLSSSAGYPPPDTLLITGKKGAFHDANKVEDCLYVFDSDAQYIDKFNSEYNRANGRLVKNFQGQPYQINLKRGLVRLSDGKCIVPQGTVIVNTESRYNTLNAEVSIGFGYEYNKWLGRPIIDAAFAVDPCYVYVVPVVVNPNDGESNTAYLAAAKLQLDPNLTPPYRVVQLYDDPQPKVNQYLREIEVDSDGKLYVLKIGALNKEEDILLVYDTQTAVVLNSIELGTPTGNTYLPAPNAMYLSDQIDMLYLASSLNDPCANSTVLYALSTKDFTLVEVADINEIGHITDITVDDATGTVWVVGITMYGIFDDPYAFLIDNSEPFYKPYLAQITSGSGQTVQAICLSNPVLYPDNDLALPLSIVWTGPKDKCVKVDVDDNGEVNLKDLANIAAYWLEMNCGPCGGVDFNNDGNVSINDLQRFCDCWLWELN